MTLVLGIDSSTQSTKAVLVDADDGTVVETRVAPHPAGTEVDPRAWLAAYDEAARAAARRAPRPWRSPGSSTAWSPWTPTATPVRDALLWNDTRSAAAARDLVAEMRRPAGLRRARSAACWWPRSPSTKLRWLRDHEPDAAAPGRPGAAPARLRLAARQRRPAPRRSPTAATPRAPATSTPPHGAWRPDLARRGARATRPRCPRSSPGGARGRAPSTGAVVAAGTGDNMGGALGHGARPGDVLVSIGTSGVVSAVSRDPVADGTGTVTGFADAESGFLPMVTTMNAAGILDLQARWLGVDHDELAALALDGAVGLRRPHAPALLRRRAHPRPARRRRRLARADAPRPRAPTWPGRRSRRCCARSADAVDQLVATTGITPARVLLVGGATRSPALRALAPALLGRAGRLPAPGEYVALGAARQAAWALAGTPAPPAVAAAGLDERPAARPTTSTRGAHAAYAALRDRA